MLDTLQKHLMCWEQLLERNCIVQRQKSNNKRSSQRDLSTSTGSTLNKENYILRLYLQRSFRSEQLATVRTYQSVHVSVYIPKIEHHKFQTFEILLLSVRVFLFSFY